MLLLSTNNPHDMHPTTPFLVYKETKRGKQSILYTPRNQGKYAYMPILSYSYIPYYKRITLAHWRVVTKKKSISIVELFPFSNV